MTKKTAELKKGTRVLLAYGEQNGELATCNDYVSWVKLDFTKSSFKPWEADLLDNVKGGIRFAKVYGWEEEMGSVYSFDIICWKDAKGNWNRVEHTPKELKSRELARAIGID